VLGTAGYVAHIVRAVRYCGGPRVVLCHMFGVLLQRLWRPRRGLPRFGSIIAVAQEWPITCLMYYLETPAWFVDIVKIRGDLPRVGSCGRV